MIRHDSAHHGIYQISLNSLGKPISTSISEHLTASSAEDPQTLCGSWEDREPGMAFDDLHTTCRGRPCLNKLLEICVTLHAAFHNFGNAKPCKNPIFFALRHRVSGQKGPFAVSQPDIGLCCPESLLVPNHHHRGARRFTTVALIASNAIL